MDPDAVPQSKCVQLYRLVDYIQYTYTLYIRSLVSDAAAERGVTAVYP